MDDLMDRLLHYAAMPLWGPACLVMRALDACVGDTYERALHTAEAVAADVIAARDARAA
jgi:hypothetical protein